MLRPTYSIVVAGTTLSSDTLGPLRALVVERAKNSGADRTDVLLGRSAAVAAAEGDPVTVELGWDGETALVFTGEVEAVQRGIDAIRITCAGAQAKLQRTRTDKAFVDQTAGQVVSTVASDAGVTTATVEDGIKLPAYRLDSGRRVHEHCLGLARRCGFDLYTDEDGALVFAPFAASSPDATFRFGAEILRAAIERGVPLDSYAVAPESAASSQGDDASAWFVKDSSPHVGQGGSGGGSATHSDPVLRTKEAAATAALAVVDRAARDSLTGTVEVPGAPEVVLGGAVELSDLPDDDANGMFQVMAVRHSLDARRGFRTTVAIAGVVS